MNEYRRSLEVCQVGLRLPTGREKLDYDPRNHTKKTFVPFRVIWWIDRLRAGKTIHEAHEKSRNIDVIFVRQIDSAGKRPA